MSQSPIQLRLGTRGSLLARAQSGMIAREIERIHPWVKVDLIIIRTTGDAVQDRPLHEIGGKGLFTKELELALLRGEVDFAVHSFKDVPVTMPLVDQSDLIIAAVPPRETALDALVSLHHKDLASLPQGARVGTSSLRRRCQVLDRRPDLVIEPLRGNIDTRLRKLKDGEFDAVILAAAGARRAGLWDADKMSLCEDLLPAAAQGALALQCRRDDPRTIGLLGALNDETTARCVEAEREVVRILEGDCHSPIAAYGFIENGQLHLRVCVGGRGGAAQVLRAEGRGEIASPQELARSVCRDLHSRGAKSLLHGTADA